MNEDLVRIRPMAVGAVISGLWLIFGLLMGLPLWAFFVGLLVIVTVFSLDAHARVQEYIWLRDHTPMRTMIKDLHLMKRSYCSRGVAIALHGDAARTVYHLWGYRWWHILPDGAPQCFFKSAFYRNVFCGKV